MMQYRREIDGLRALAILPVMLFHAGFQTFSGGFVGVDVFFVISGYLITTIILSEHETGTFTLAGFYERRARRILPALFVVMLACLPVAWAWLSPQDMKRFSQSLVAVSVFSSNILFWRTSGYFDTAAELKPLLHTWSLAIEEQYYFFFPLFLMLTWPLGRRRIRNLLILLALASLAAAQWGAQHRPTATFYLLPTRSWELLIGALLAFHLSASRPPSSVRLRQAGSIAGFAMLALAVFCFNEKTPFPGVYALLPTIGTALLILCATPETRLGAWLGHPVPVRIGLISYSAYLWHQPLFAFARHIRTETPGPLLFGGLTGLALVLAYATWKYVETPSRNRQTFGRRQVFRFAVLGSAFFVLAGAGGIATQGYARIRTTPEQARMLASAVPSPKRASCHTGGADYLKPAAACAFNPGPVRWATFGDSHTVELAYALAEAVAPRGEGLKEFSFSGCTPAFGLIPDGTYKPCADWTRESIDYIAQNPDIRNVVVSYRINAALFGKHENRYPALPDDIGPSLRMQRWQAYIGLLRHLQSRGKHVYLVLQAPELPKPVDAMLAATPHPPADMTGARRSWWTARNRFVSDRLGDIPAGVTLIDPSRLFCDAAHCMATRQGISFYFDDNHLSVAGARVIANEIVRRTPGT